MTTHQAREAHSRLPERGTFGGQALVGPFELDVATLAATRPLYGMRREGVYLWGTLRDEGGDLHTILRRIPNDWRTARNRRLLIQSTAGGHDALHIHPSGKSSASYVDASLEEIDADAAVWRSDPEEGGRSFQAEYRTDGCSSVEEDIFALTGRPVQPGMQWYVPGRDASLAYLATIFQLEGTIFGRPCRGFIGIDPVYMYEGGELYRKKDPLIEEGLEHLWYTWATRYTDGSLDAGHFMLGNDKFGFAIVTDEHQNVRYSTDVHGEFEVEDGYWQTGARLTFNGEDYEFLPDPRGRMPDFGSIPNPQVDGRWRRVGDTREPEVWFAWGEVIPANGPRPRDTYRF